MSKNDWCIENDFATQKELAAMEEHNTTLLWAENKSLRATIARLEAELEALREACRPVVKLWGAVRARYEDEPEWDEPLTPNVLYLEAIGTEKTGSRYVSVEELDALAALVGEELL